VSDSAGGSASAAATVRIDTRKPTTRAYKAGVRTGSLVRLAYRVNDARPGCDRAAVTPGSTRARSSRRRSGSPGLSPATPGRASVGGARCQRAPTRSRSTPPTWPATRRARSAARG
jgi:hypothetical protein